MSNRPAAKNVCLIVIILKFVLSDFAFMHGKADSDTFIVVYFCTENRAAAADRRRSTPS